MRSTLFVVLLVACQSPVQFVHPVPEDRETALAAIDQAFGSAMLASYHRQREREPAPLALAPTDGSELELRELAATITLDGPLAHTELHLTFHNSEPRAREGRFSITLPADAAVSRFAMRNGDEWREARAVTREQGQRVYESYLHKKVDPALLEKDLDNQFSARVFPIAASANKEIIVAYDHLVSEADPYTLALRGLPIVAKQTIAIARDGAPPITREVRDRRPDDVVVPIAPGSYAVAAGDVFVARLDVSRSSTPAPLDRALILVDTSASRATIMGRQAELLRALLADLQDTDVAIAAFDQGVTELYRGPARDASPAVVRLLEHGALGASDLGAALAMAASSGIPRVIVIGDGTPTSGEHEPTKLAQIVRGSAIERVDAIQVGSAIDLDVLRAVVSAGHAPGAILDGRELARVAHGLATAMPTEQPIRVDGAIETWPATTRGVGPGDPVWVFGVRGKRHAADPIAVRVGNQATTLAPHVADETHIRRAVAIEHAAALGEQLERATDADRPALAHQLEQLALANNLVSSRTSLLVLETDGDEARMLGPVDPTATTQGITITDDYTRNIPVGRTFSAELGAAAGSQRDSVGTFFSGATSLENVYVVDGVSTSYAGGANSSAIEDQMAAGVDPSVIVEHLTERALTTQPAPTATPPSEPVYAAPYVDRMRDVMDALAHTKRARALDIAARWQLSSPGEVAALIALGEALEARGSNALAARAYGSLIDLYPDRAELVRAAGERLDRVTGARALAIDAYRRAIRERPDQVSTYRLLAYDLMREHDVAALTVLGDALDHVTRASVRAILLQDHAIVSAYLLAHVPGERATIVNQRRAPAPTRPSLRFVLSWETDGNDVDLHVRDRFGGHAFYAHRDLPSGGHLLDDITDGFGPEMFVVDQPSAGPYELGVHYFSRGPEGLGIGSVQVIRDDGNGHVTVDDRPFVIQNDHAFVELGSVEP